MNTPSGSRTRLSPAAQRSGKSSHFIHITSNAPILVKPLSKKVSFVRKRKRSPKPVVEPETPPEKSGNEEPPPPESVKDDSPSPESVKDEPPPPESVKDESPPPESVKDESPPPESVKDESPPPESVKDEPPPPEEEMREEPELKPPEKKDQSCQVSDLGKANLEDTACQTEPSPEPPLQEMVASECQTDFLPEVPAERETVETLDKDVQTVILHEEQTPPEIQIIYCHCACRHQDCVPRFPTDACVPSSYSGRFLNQRCSISDLPLPNPSCYTPCSAGKSTFRRSSNACNLPPACNDWRKRQCSSRSNHVWSNNITDDEEGPSVWRCESMRKEIVRPKEWRNFRHCHQPLIQDLDLKDCDGFEMTFEY